MKPLISKRINNLIPKEVIEAHYTLQARRKLFLILKSKAVQKTPLPIGNLVEVFAKQQHEKRGSWLAPKPILTIDYVTRSVTIPGKGQLVPTVSIEDFRLATQQDSLAQLIQKGINFLDGLVTDLTGNISNTEKLTNSHAEEAGEIIDITPDTDFSNDTATFARSAGDKISVFWPEEGVYYDGVVDSAEDNANLNIRNA